MTRLIGSSPDARLGRPVVEVQPHFPRARQGSRRPAAIPLTVRLSGRPAEAATTRAIFGRDYAKEIWAFVAERYEVESLYGAPPFRSARFGILLLRRKDLDAVREVGG